MSQIKQKQFMVTKYSHVLLTQNQTQIRILIKFLSKSGPWIKGYVSLSPNPVDDDVLVILGHEVVQGQKYNSPLKAF